MAPFPETTSDFKTHARHEVLTTRATKGQREHMLDDEVLIQWLQEWLSNTVGDLTNPVAAAYVPAGDKPGASVSNLTGGEPDQGSVEVLTSAVSSAWILPLVCPPDPSQPLCWGYYSDSFSKGRFGLLEPVPVKGVAGPGESGAADATILPVAATDPASGMRLRHGVGYYGRSLAFAWHDGDTDGVRAAAITVAVSDTELRAELVHDGHDAPADHVIALARISRT